MSEFKEFGKIARYNRDIVITEKIDGTNAAVIVEEFPFGHHAGGPIPDSLVMGPPSEEDGLPRHEYTVTAQSRNRLLVPGKGTDNFGFAQWVQDHKFALVKLGPGYHYGEWYGMGIQRTYALGGKRFALFNVLRWKCDEEQSKIFNAVQAEVSNLELVPLLYRGPRLETDEWMRGATMSMPEITPTMIDMPSYWIQALKNAGSKAVPGYMKPEGIVVFHTASRQYYKVTVEKDEAHKGATPGMHNQKEENPTT